MKKAGRLLLVLFLMFSLNACDTWDDWFDDDDDDDTTTADTVTPAADTDTPASVDTTDVTSAGNLNYDHYNPSAWKGRGSAVVLCSNSPSMIACDIDGHPLPKHGSYDQGRAVWTAFNDKGLSGTLSCTTASGNTYTTTVSGSGLQWGSCSGNNQ